MNMIVSGVFWLLLLFGVALSQRGRGTGSSTLALQYHQNLRGHALHPETTQLGAIVMLVSNWTTIRYARKCHFNASMDALASKWRPHNQYPIILLDTKPWLRSDMVSIRRNWPTLDFKFLNVENVFNSVPTIPLGQLEDHKKPKSSIPYKQMCHFFFKGFTQVPLLMRYRYLLRLDDDTCLLDHINFDLFQYLASVRAAYAYSHIWYDDDRTTTGLYDFVNRYVAENNLTYKNPTLHKAISSSKLFPSRVPCYNTNFEVIDTLRYREAAVTKFVDAVVQSNMIFHRRWGDAPLRFPTVMLFSKESEVVRLEGFELQHSNWPVFPMSEHPTTSDPDLFM